MFSQPVRPLIFAVFVAMAPLVFQLPLWTVGWCLIIWAGILFQESRGWAAPSKRIRLAAFSIGMAAVLLSAGLKFDGKDFMVMLAVLAGIKPLEINSKRDCMMTILLAYFLVITSLFVFENLVMMLYLFVSVWVTTGVLIHVNNSRQTIGRQMRLSARLIFGAVPLMLLLFFLFPRFSGGFWGSPWARFSYSGFSSSMGIGDVSKLVLVDATAFSVSFESTVPDVDQLYWRGIIFQRFDGRNWHAVPGLSTRKESVSGENMVQYSVILEPHGHRNLFVLDLPVSVRTAARILEDHTLVARWPIRQRFHYSAASVLKYRQESSHAPSEFYLQVPLHRNPRTIALAEKWRSTHKTPNALIAAALDYFRSNAFQYTLEPESRGPDSVDQFLFVSRKGFCEHFATAFTLLMRTAGVPTRIVGGYQGGRWNDVGKFLTVRQSDAHVWCEVWLQGQGWLRVDPTMVASPDRIGAGIESIFDAENLPKFLSANRGKLLVDWIDVVKQTWEAVNIRWNMWFMGFSLEDQLSILRKLGMSASRRALWLLLPILFLLSVVIMILLNRLAAKLSQKPSEDRALKIYKRFLRKMARFGMPKMDHQGPMDYARSAVGRYPLLKFEIMAITENYIKLRYGTAAGQDLLGKMHRLVRRFNPRKTKDA